MNFEKNTLRGHAQTTNGISLINYMIGVGFFEHHAIISDANKWSKVFSLI